MLSRNGSETMDMPCWNAWGQSRIRILLADDHENVRVQVRTRLSREPDFEVVEAINSAQVIESAITVKPQIVLIDPMMRDGAGLQSVRQVSLRAPEMAIVVLIAFADTALQMELRKMGVRRILDKGIESQQLVSVLREIGDALTTETAKHRILPSAGNCQTLQA